MTKKRRNKRAMTQIKAYFIIINMIVAIVAFSWMVSGETPSNTVASGTTLTGASVLISSIPATYKNLQLVVRNFLPSLDNAEIRLRFNDDSTANRHASDTSNLDGQTFNATMIRLGPGPSNSTSQSLTITDIYDYANTATWKMANSNTVITYHVDTSKWSFANIYGLYNQTGAISSIRLLANSGNLTSGTANSSCSGSINFNFCVLHCLISPFSNFKAK